MLLEKWDAILDLSDPNIILGPHKHRPTERLLGNGDLLVCKKKKDQDGVSTGMTVSSATDNGNHILSSMPPPPPLSLTNQAHTALNAGQNTNHVQSHFGCDTGSISPIPPSLDLWAWTHCQCHIAIAIASSCRHQGTH